MHPDNADTRRQWLTHHKVCEICGTPFTSHRSHAKYCSAKCRKRASRDGAVSWQKQFFCEECGKQIFPTQPNQIIKYCSNACKQRAYRRMKREE